MAITREISFEIKTSLIELADNITRTCENEEIVDFIQEIDGCVGETEFSYNLIKELVSDYVAGLEDDEVDDFFQQLQKDIP